MIGKILKFSLSHKVVIIAGVLILLGFGINSFLQLSIEAYPDVTDTSVQIIVKYPGIASEEIEKQVSIPLEFELNGLPYATQIRSQSLFGLSVITIIFDDTVDKYFARQLVFERISNLDLPVGTDISLAPLSTPIGELYRYTIESSNHSSMELRTLQDWVLRTNLKKVNGVADVVSFGGTVKQFQVFINPIQLNSYDLSLQEVSNALEASNKNTGGGYLIINNEQYAVRGIGLLESTEDISNVVIKAINGVPIKISNIATVFIGPAVREGIVGNNKKRDLVEGIVLMRKGENPAKVLHGIKSKIAELQKSLPQGVKINTVYDREHLINKTLENVVHTLLSGVFLVFLILYIFTGQWTMALIVTLIVPLSLLCAFILMKFNGISASLLSLGAIDFGIIIDGSVVMTETIFVALAHLHKYNPKVLKNTIVETGIQASKPIMFAKTIIILAFLPLFALERVEGRLFEPLALTMCFAVMGALILTLTFVPVLSSIFFKNKVEEKETWIIQKIKSFYLPLLYKLIKAPKRILNITVIVILTSFCLIPFLGTEFLPEIDEGAIWVRATMPISISINEAHNVADKISKRLSEFPQIQTSLYQIGRPEDATDPNLQNNTEIFLDLIDKEKWGCTKSELVTKIDKALRNEFPGIIFTFSQPISDNVNEAVSGVKGQVAAKVFGPDLKILLSKAKEIAKILNKVEGIHEVFVDQLVGQPQLQIQINRELCARYGIKVNDIQNVIEVALAGKAVTQFIDNEKHFDVLLRLSPDYRDDIDTIKNIIIESSDNKLRIPLAQLASFERKDGAPIIYRENNSRRASVRFSVVNRDMGGAVMEAQRKVEQAVDFPEGYRVVWSGQFESQQRAMSRLLSIAPLSIFLILILLFADFNSFTIALFVLTTILYAAVGALFGLFVNQIHLSVSALVGFIALSGVSVQNGIILVSAMRSFMKLGMKPRIAVIKAVKEKLRPVVMTSLLASMGLLPAALSSGTGSEIQKPFAVVIVFGMISAMIFSLITMPPLYLKFFSKEELEE